MAEPLEFDVSGFQSLKAQIRDANIEYQKLVQAVDATPAQVQAAAQKVAMLKDQLADANDNAAALTEQGKFAAFTKGLASISGGFTAVQGAIGLVNSDSKAFEKTLLQLQSAMALTQGLTALAGIKDAFIAMRVAAIASFQAIVAGFRSLAAAITTTGVGALIVALGVGIALLVDYFNDLSDAEKAAKKSIDDTNRSLEKQIALSEDLGRRRDNELKIQEARAKLEGKSLEQISALRRKNLIQDRNDAIALVVEINKAQNNFLANFKGTEEEKNKALEDYAAKRKAAIAARNTAETELELEKISLQQAIRDRDQAAQDKRTNDQKEKDKKALDAKVKQLEAQKELDLANIESNELLALRFAKTEEEKARISQQFFNERIGVEEKFEKDREKLRPQEEKNATLLQAKLKDLNNQRVENNQKTEENITKIVKDEEEKRLKAQEEAAKKAEELLDKTYKYREDVISRYYIDRRQELVDSIKNEQQLEFAKRDLQIQEDKARLKNLLDRYGEFSVEYMKAQEKLADDEKKLEKDKKDYKIKTAMDTFNGIMDTAKMLSDGVQAFQDRDKQRELEALKAKGLSREQAAKEEDAINKKYFEKNKGVQIANAIIQTLQGAVSAFASLAGIPVVGPTLAAVAAAAALAAGYANVQKIRETTYTSQLDTSKTQSTGTTMYAEGGVLVGPSHNMGGIRTSMGELEGGEFVINRRSTANFLPLLEQINALGNAGGPGQGLQMQTPVVKTYVIATDVTSAQEANAKLSALARL